MNKPAVISTVADLRATLAPWRRAGETVALVPTMGALHAGHISLAQLAKRKARRAVASVFVNPTQFAPNEDFAKYPRTFETDLERLTAAGIDAVFAPTPQVIYPAGFATTVSLDGPAKAGLEDRFRPTHFAGVATIVAKLLLQSTPDFAIFGEKDFQQLAVITQMAKDLDLPVEIVGAPTVRESDGLAMSSRNVYLDTDERRRAPLLYATLQDVARRIGAGEDAESALTIGRQALADAGFVLDYLELRDATSLAVPARPLTQPLRLLVAAKLGKTRLIDNISVALS
ncbi:MULTISPECIES: pantoate--beta-alanine ligase [unclassified Beijerinckia]|uniref:pantoate--beta-alanine ligase n=1 Tax=unclassified Beijerinckia TaxID=2638183 RepID=UPI00089A05E3|nr:MULTISPECIES: pantoate--beta-alanine ligase [unclassified Beijerinckia]MDH7796484.1 pantoate--beta-alanine ligase [Beijerinckia sp. GAS462]SEC47098.1 pantothenate synthetase [Beijerinckia sp. 28-YEA-48]